MSCVLWYPCESPTPHLLAFAADQTKLWGDHPPASPLTGPRGGSSSDPLIHSAHLPNFSGPGFWGRAFRELWLFEVPPQSGSQSQGQQTQPRPVSPCCYMVLYCPNMLSFLVMSIPVLAEKKTSQPFFHTSTSFVTEATPRIVAVIVIWATVFSGDIPDLSEFKLRLLFSSTDTVSYCFENRKGGRTQTGMITLIILKAKLRVVR